MLFQAYSQDAVAEMRDVMEKGGMDSLATRGPPKAPAVSCSKKCIFFVENMISEDLWAIFNIFFTILLTFSPTVHSFGI